MSSPINFLEKYNHLSDNDRQNIKCLLSHKPLLSVEELINHLKRKGVLFNIVDEDSAKKFLSHNNYYFKFASYRANYTKRQKGKLAGQYENLEFAYLQELSTIDMYLRYLILDMSLDIEHELKVMLLHDIESKPQIDPYAIVDEFDSNKSIRVSIIKRKGSAYCKELVEKHARLLDYPIWAFLELITFGDLIKFYRFYCEKYSKGKVLPKYTLLYPIRNLRNAAAHNSCIVYKLKSQNNKSTQNDMANLLADIKTISNDSRVKYLKILPIHDFTVLLYWYSSFIKSRGLLLKRKNELYFLFFHRMHKHRTYFKENQYIQNAYMFCVKILLHFFSSRSLDTHPRY